MTKAYSNKALPSGTILREWRLEEVLGVGGFGIVYKGRGIYFDELVAIKEYFPSAISERDEESTVVPIDSDAEEVHALGLKKFVEEAKLLWNLSTPSRHPNIVSVRSLFEIHGTAYMVMDFEDGVSLTDVIKRGEKFDEAKLREMVLPVASGLERAHRVGVLHRDIKPSNILITDSGQPVLIDFGSARFEAEGVTSTTVTFHTPPYAAIEQYVKTYEQGPWTDIYALGVVLYRCITGEKPAEVLERLHGEKEPALVDGNWPGYSRAFLAAVDAAMIIKPSERPRSLSEWLAMFDEEGTQSAGFASDADDEDDEATRIVPMASVIPEIRPVATPPVPSPEPATPGAAVPDPSKAVKPAKRSKTKETDSSAEVGEKAGPASGNKASPNEKSNKPKEPVPAAKASEGQRAKAGESKLLSRPVMLGGAATLAVIAGLAWALTTRDADPGPANEPVAAVEQISLVDGFGPALAKLVELAREKNIDPKLVSSLEARATRIASLETENASLADNPAREGDIGFNRLRIADLTRASLAELGVGLSQVLTAKTRGLVNAAPWADPRRPNSAAKESPALQEQAAAVAESLRSARQSIEGLRGSKSAEEALPLAQKAILAVAAYDTAAAQALKDNPRKPKPSDTPKTETSASSSPSPTASSTQVVTGRTVEQIRQELDRVSDATDSQANEVIKLARTREPGRDASDDAKKAFQTLESNAGAARDYKRYLDTLKRSMRGAKTPAEAEQLLAQGRQTSQYVGSMLQGSRAARAVLDR
ncbi:serine/threonine protein kinase [Erythrobacter mangrovi]|uniref:non-specific serine/threonine protein kinase n=1 Tax=Erythrobacter mangrovi TaxID=2739433 RepID=A0A7D3XKE4_9SPHN|nr:serine/threonine protein kinase [Erythrobacter mangrovi]QKG72579.1 protein kinase [Erythrobacter mangrovi]